LTGNASLKLFRPRRRAESIPNCSKDTSEKSASSNATRSIYKQLNRVEDQFCYAVDDKRHTGAGSVRFPKTAEPTVLLIDPNPLKQQLRATVLRNCEIDVQTTDNLTEAQKLCRVQRYDMILLAADGDSDAALISGELWKVSPRQRIALFVGPPKHLQEIGARQSQVSISAK
jgi:hypothetical protein